MIMPCDWVAEHTFEPLYMDRFEHPNSQLPQRNSIVWCKVDHLVNCLRFARSVENSWPHRYVIIAQNGDICYGAGELSSFWPLPRNIEKLYSVNLSFLSPDRSRLIGIPRGIPSAWGDFLAAITESWPQLLSVKREVTGLVYLCAPTRDGHVYPVRKSLYNALREHPWATCECEFDRVAPSHFHQQMRSHRYTLSPIGFGVDCHRTHEALYLQSIPIVPDTPEMRNLDYLPMLYYRDVSELTEDRLRDPEVWGPLQDRLDHYRVPELSMTFWRADVAAAFARCHT